jgi:hypothetical protein
LKSLCAESRKRVLSPFVARVVIANPLQLEPNCPKCAREKRIAERTPSHKPNLRYIRGLPGPMALRGGLSVPAVGDCAKVSAGKLTLVN